MLYTDVGQQAVVYVPTEFYGCILVVIINKHGVIIGHFAREKSGNVVCMQDQMSFDDMISKLEDAESEVDVDNVADTREWIIYSNDTSTRSPGYRAIINKLVDADAMNIPKANIVPIPYRRGGGGGNSDKLWYSGRRSPMVPEPL